MAMGGGVSEADRLSEEKGAGRGGEMRWKEKERWGREKADCMF